MQYPCETLITADFLVTQNERREVIENAAVAVSEGRVLALGRNADLAGYTPKRTLRLGNALVLPGLVNAHTHVAMTFLRGIADDLPLMDWLHNHIFPLEKHLSADIVEIGSLLGCAEMLRTGTTAFQDMYLLEDSVCKAVDASGMKARVGEVIFAFPSLTYSNQEEALDHVRAQAKRLDGHERIRLAIMPHTVYTTTPELLRRCRELAEELDLPVHIHLAESAAETTASLNSLGKRPVQVCADNGLLGPNTSLAHAVDLTEEETALIASSGTQVAHCPKSNMKLTSGIAPVPDMLGKGLTPGIGTDGAASNNSLNLFSEMSSCALLHKVRSMDPTALPAQTVLDMATLGGAAALHWEGLGSLTPGGPADLIALDLDSPNLQPFYSPASHLVYAASGHEVRLTMVNGEILYQDGAYHTLDYPLLLKEAQKLKRWVLNKNGGV